MTRKPLLTTASRLAISYIRFSSAQQKLGDSLRRQIERTAAYCAEHGLHLDESIRDEGLSGYHGTHRKKGALGRFLERVEAGDIPRGSVLIVEAFDRMSRQTPREAMSQFLDLINAGIAIVTLIDGQRYSADTVDKNVGQLFVSIGMMLAANAESANKADRSRANWTKRRGTPTGLLPSWIIRIHPGDAIDLDKYEIDPAFPDLAIDKAKAAIIRRIFDLLLTMGAEAIAALLNSEGVPILSDYRREAGAHLWKQGTLQKLLRGKQVLGMQEVGRYVENKRQSTGEWVKAYPAIVSEKMWQAAQAAMDGRKSGPATGRNVERVTNLFGDLARCACGARMKVYRRGPGGNYVYFGCSVVHVGGCTNKTFHRLDKVERNVLAFFAERALGDWKVQPKVDRTALLTAQIAKTKQDAGTIEAQYERSLLRSGDLAERLQTKLEADHKAKLAAIAKLERDLAAITTATPVDVQVKTVKELAGRLDGLQGVELVAARAKIASALPGIVQAITFAPNGDFVAAGAGWTIDFPHAGITQWIVRRPQKVAA